MDSLVAKQKIWYDSLMEWFSVSGHKYFYIKLPNTNAVLPWRRDSEYLLGAISINHECVRIDLKTGQEDDQLTRGVKVKPAWIEI